MIRTDDDERANRHFIINPAGEITASYDKIHMFDADVNDGERYRRSQDFKAGSTPCLTAIDGHKSGLSICYDLRFAGLYHHYAKLAEAEIILTPLSLLLPQQAGALACSATHKSDETGAFVIASAQTGTHDDGERTGHADYHHRG